MRKVLSFVVVLALVLSSFSMAFAADTATTAAGLSDISGNANVDAIQVAYDLGIVTGNPDGTFLPDKTVTRAEFAAMLTRALAIPDSALAGYTTTTFLDTEGYTWAVPYLAFCQSKGIMLGDGAGNAMPGRTITVNEAMTMALRAIGYTASSSLLVGAWPANYVSIAQNEELYDDVAKDTTVTKASAAQIIYNLLTVQKVAVNTDGTTDYLWKDKNDDVEANLLNTNHNCKEIADAILGSTAGCGYDDAVINITKNLGAYGTAYINDDDEMIAFTKDDSVALTGKLSDDLDEFEVGDIKYDIDDDDNDFTSYAAFFINGDDEKVLGHGDDDFITVGGIEAWAEDYADDGDTVTLNVELSGKTIKDIYSVVAWSADFNGDYDLAADDVQDEITDDHSLLSFDFVEDDDDNIDFNSFELAGAASLDAIAEDDVVYVYANKDDDIRKVAVGTETVEGAVDEIEYDEDADGKDVADTVTIDGTDYDVAALATSDVLDLDVDSDGTFYLDAYGDIYDFDGTSGAADTFGVVKAFEIGDDFDNAKVKLYLSDDSTKTLNFSESNTDLDDMDWVTESDLTTIDTDDDYADLIDDTNPDFAFDDGALIGYSLDSSGDIDTLDVTSVRFDFVNFQSTKVLKAGDSSSNSKSYSIDSDCVVFSYDNEIGATGDYDVSSLTDVENKDGTVATNASPAAIILNDDGDVVALFVEESFTSGDDYIYGVINKKTSAPDGSGDTVSKFSGYIDGSSFAYKADDEYKAIKAGTFDVYKIKADSSSIITDIFSLTKGDKYKDDDKSGWIVTDARITDLEDNKTVVTVTDATQGDDGKYTIADDAVVYEWDADDEEFTVSDIKSLKDTKTKAGVYTYHISLFDTKDSDADGVASVVIFYEE